MKVQGMPLWYYSITMFSVWAGDEDLLHAFLFVSALVRAVEEEQLEAMLVKT